MMDKQQKIVEMAKDICRVKLNCNDVCNPISACDALKYAERAVEAGYSKQSEVANEIFKDILNIIREYSHSACIAKNNYGITQAEYIGIDILKLKKKYEEVQK